MKEKNQQEQEMQKEIRFLLQQVMKMQLNKAEVKVEYAQMLDSVVVLQSYDEGISSNIEDENYRESIDEVDYNNQSKVQNEPLQETPSSMQTSVNQSID